MAGLNKRGVEGNIWTIVVLVSLIILLVLVVIGTTGGFGNLWGNIKNYMSSTNVDSIVNTCSVQCSTNQKYEFCTAPKELRIREDLTSGEDVKCTTSGKDLYTCTGTCDKFRATGKLSFENCNIVC